MDMQEMQARQVIANLEAELASLQADHEADAGTWEMLKSRMEARNQRTRTITDALRNLRGLLPVQENPS